jgi:hypothetical protein
LNEARQVGELTREVLIRAFAMKALQDRLNLMKTAAKRKDAIMRARWANVIDDEQTTLLTEAYGLETA